MKRVVHTAKAPAAKGPYSQAIIHGGVMYVSGQIPLDPDSGNIIKSTIEEETSAILNNLQAIVLESGAAMTDVLKVTCYLTDMDDFSRFNEVYSRYFQIDPPARTTIEAARLPLGARVEVDAIVAVSCSPE
ncbi:MAG: hypothetical protein ISR96_00045 [Nitrospira sp.]|nr:hypothetical protein [bacterium]MBL7047905.1 hypothetical protein [Nitrospira sp.]